MCNHPLTSESSLYCLIQVIDNGIALTKFELHIKHMLYKTSQCTLYSTSLATTNLFARYILPFLNQTIPYQHAIALSCACLNSASLKVHARIILTIICPTCLQIKQLECIDILCLNKCMFDNFINTIAHQQPTQFQVPCICVFVDTNFDDTNDDLCKHHISK